MTLIPTGYVAMKNGNLLNEGVGDFSARLEAEVMEPGEGEFP